MPGKTVAPISSGANPKWLFCALMAVLGLAAAPTRGDSGYAAPVSIGTPQIISSDVDPSTGYYSIINRLTGAERFYLNGYFGNSAMIANVEAGHVWNGHETLANVTSYISNSPINDAGPQYDYHATAVGFTMVGLGPAYYGSYLYYQFGMAPGAFLSSVAIATDWVGSSGQFDISPSTFVYGYKTVMQDGVDRTLVPGISITRTVNVVNSSWGYGDPAGTDQYTRILDAFTYVNHQTVCVAAGNHDAGTAPVTGPASGFNVIAVGALGDDKTQPPYQTVAPFSNTGPIDFYNPRTHRTITGVRPGVSIVAPGSDLIAPAYVGATGTNSDGSLFDVSSFPPDQLDKLYFLGISGTSFASPIVAGGAALIVDAGYVNYGGGAAIDGRIVKAVLLNSATKTIGWDNHTTRHGHVLFTSQGLDYKVGAGALNLDRAYDQYLTSSYHLESSGRGGKLTVQTTGWAFSHISCDGPQDYLLNQPLHRGDTLTVTSDWFVPISFTTAATPDPTTGTFDEQDLHPTYFDQLDLQVWRWVKDKPQKLIAECFSPYINVDQLYFKIPQDGSYAIRVNYMGTTYDVFNNSPHELDYGLAWSVTPGIALHSLTIPLAPTTALGEVPEPGTLLMFLAAPFLMLRRRGRR